MRGGIVWLKIVYKKDEMELPIITNQSDYEGVEPYKIILINPEWLLQLSRLRLALAMSLNERLGEHSSLKDIPEEIITSIGENIEEVVGERPLKSSGTKLSVKEGGVHPNIFGIPVPSWLFDGGGQKKKRKSKRKKRKTRKRKSKRKKHKTKRRN
jgi:hypothetical protein